MTENRIGGDKDTMKRLNKTRYEYSYKDLKKMVWRKYISEQRQDK